MGASVSNFVADVGKTIAKGATTALGGMIPVVGPALAEGVNSLYKKGGIVTKRFEAGGVVPAGFKAKAINTPAELIRVIKQFPAEAAKANLSVQDVKDAIEELKGTRMARGGMAKRMAHGGMADGGMAGGYMMPDPQPSPLNPGRDSMFYPGALPGTPFGPRGGMFGQRMAMGGMASYSVEPGTPFYSMMSGQRAAARGRGGGLP
jgi:hypothetical protein